MPLSAKLPTQKTAATLMLAFANSISRLRSRYQQLTPTTNTAPSTQPLSTVWKNLATAIGESATAAKSTISLRTVSGLNAMPTGYCIQALATRIHHAEKCCTDTCQPCRCQVETFTYFVPAKEHNGNDVASIKKARIPSMASGAPKISPTNQE